MSEQIEFREDPRYGYAVARVRALEARTPDDFFFARLKTETTEGAMRLLMDSVYRDAFSTVSGLSAFPQVLESHLKWVFDEAEEMSVEPNCIQALRLRYDYHNLGPTFFAFVGKSSWDPKKLSALGRLNRDVLLMAVQKKDDTVLREFFGEVWIKSLDLWNQGQGDSVRQSLNALWDEAYWSRVLQEAKASKIDFLKHYFQLKLRWENLVRLARHKMLARAGSEVQIERVADPEWTDDEWKCLSSTSLDQMGEVVSLGILQKPFDEAVSAALDSNNMERFQESRFAWIDELMTPTKYVIHGVEPLVAYCLKKEVETDKLRSILVRLVFPVGEGNRKMVSV